MSLNGGGNPYGHEESGDGGSAEEFKLPPENEVYRSLHVVEDAPVYRSMTAHDMGVDVPSMHYANGAPFMEGASQTFECEDVPVYRSLGAMAERPTLQSSAHPFSAPSLVGHSQMRGLAKPDLVKPELQLFPGQGKADAAMASAAPLASPSLEEATPFPLPKLPFALEHTHVFLIRPAGKNIVPAIGKVLDDCGVDVVFKPNKCKWKATSFEQGASLEFRVRLYENPEKSIIFEAQRRRGDLLQFKRMYISICAALAERGLAKAIEGRAPMPRCALSDQRPLDDDELAASMDPLFTMLNGTFVEAQTEAAARLVALSTSSARSGAYKRQLKHLVEMIKSTNLDRRRCVISMLANLSEVAKDTQALVVEEGVLRLLMPLAAPVSSLEVDKETQRESCRLIASLCENFPDQIKAVATEPVQQLFASCDTISDARLQRHVQRARDILSPQQPM